MRVRVVSATIALAVLALTLWVIAQPQPDSSIAKGRESIPTDLRKVLESGDIFLLLQIDPLPSAMRAEAGLPRLRLFHDYGIIQTVPITNQADRRRILDALYKGVSDLPRRSKRGRATSVRNSGALGRPRRSEGHFLGLLMAPVESLGEFRAS